MHRILSHKSHIANNIMSGISRYDISNFPSNSTNNTANNILSGIANGIMSDTASNSNSVN